MRFCTGVLSSLFLFHSMISNCKAMVILDSKKYLGSKFEDPKYKNKSPKSKTSTSAFVA